MSDLVQWVAHHNGRRRNFRTKDALLDHLNDLVLAGECGTVNVYLDDERAVDVELVDRVNLDALARL